MSKMETNAGRGGTTARIESVQMAMSRDDVQHWRGDLRAILELERESYDVVLTREVIRWTPVAADHINRRKKAKCKRQYFGELCGIGRNFGL